MIMNKDLIFGYLAGFTFRGEGVRSPRSEVGRTGRGTHPSSPPSFAEASFSDLGPRTSDFGPRTSD